MKIKSGLSLNKVGKRYIVTDDSKELFNGMIKLNKSGAFIFELLQNDISEENAVNQITEKYDVDKNTAEIDFAEFVKVFETLGLIAK